MILTPDELKVVKSFLLPAVQNGLLAAEHLAELLKIASAGNAQSNVELEELFTIREAADRLHCHPKSVWRFIREERLECVHLTPKAARIPRSSLEKFMQQKT